MSKKCEICGKEPVFGNNVSHSQRKTPRRFNPNIQKVRADINGTVKKINVCTSCIRSNKVKRAV
ncbi:MAG: 50S ribosomal protein L28 [Actinobacteria bacterium]|nr:50S ribosomal protein L28 [Actinomycetota bacterium]